MNNQQPARSGTNASTPGSAGTGKSDGRRTVVAPASGGRSYSVPRAGGGGQLSVKLSNGKIVQAKSRTQKQILESAEQIIAKAGEKGKAGRERSQKKRKLGFIHRGK